MMIHLKRTAFAVMALAAVACSQLHAKPAKDQPRETSPAAQASAPAAAGAPLAASDTFFREEGAHFENMYETWEVYGDLRDQDGKRYDLTAFFGQTGGAYMNVRFGYTSFQAEGGEYYYNSLVPATFKEAAVRKLKTKLQSDPENVKLKETLERIDKGETPHYEPFEKTGDVYRTILFIDYGKNRFVRISRTSFQYSLQMNVQNNRLSALLESSGDPVQFKGDNAIGSESSSMAMAGYVFPEMKLTATLILPDSKVKTLTGKVVFAHFWCDPDRASFSRYNMMYLPYDGGGLYNFTFMTPNGAPLLARTYVADNNGELMHQPGAEVKETEQWMSELSGLTYPKSWSVKTPAVEGVVALPDTKHEMTVLEGVGSFYLGPCDFTPDKGGSAARGLCRMIAPETN